MKSRHDIVKKRQKHGNVAFQVGGYSMSTSITRILLILFAVCCFTAIRATPGHSAGTVVYQGQHTPFGEQLFERGSLAGKVAYTFTGEERDPQLAMVDYGARFYHPRLGRFTATDPIDHHGLSPYAYVANNPMRYVDPTGKQGMDASAAWNIAGAVQSAGEKVCSAFRGWYQQTFANVPQLQVEPNPRDIQNYHEVAAVGLLTAAVLTAVEWEVSASDPTGTVSGSVSTAGKAKAKVSSAYGDVRLSLGPDGLSSSGSLKTQEGPLEMSVNSEGRPSLRAKFGDTSVGMSADGTMSLVLKGTGASVNPETGKASVSAKSGVLGISAKVDPQKTKGLVDRAMSHINQAQQVNQSQDVPSEAQ